MCPTYLVIGGRVSEVGMGIGLGGTEHISLSMVAATYKAIENSKRLQGEQFPHYTWGPVDAVGGCGGHCTAR